MNIVDDRYVKLVSSRLDKFTVKKSNLYNFRCPYCGDSQKHKSKARGYFFLKTNDVIFKCHNCGVGRTIGNFLKDNAPDLYDEYLLERYKEGMTGKGTVVPTPKFKQTDTKQRFKSADLVSIVDLNNDHPAKQYLLSRKIPQESLSNLFYCERFKRWVNTKKPGTFENLQNDRPRIIIPLIDFDGTWFGIQGRSLEPKAKLRYISIMFDDATSKVFGLNRINKEERIYVTEGPFDSLFLRNSLAMCGSDVSLDSFNFSDVVYIYDNEPRNRQIVDRMSDCIDRGDSLVIWSNEIKEKDINDMIIAGYNIQTVIESSIYSGLEAKVKLNSWRRV